METSILYLGIYDSDCVASQIKDKYMNSSKTDLYPSTTY